MEIVVAKSGTKTQNTKIKKDAIYITLTGEYPENRPECICINEENKIYALAPCMKNEAGQIISDKGVKYIANKLDREVEEIEKWNSTHLFLSKKGEFMMKLTYDNGPIYVPYLDKDEHNELKDMAHREFRLRQEFNQFSLFFGCLLSVKNSNRVTTYKTLDTRSLDFIVQGNDAWKDPKLLLKRIDSMPKHEVDLFEISHLWNSKTNRIKNYWAFDGGIQPQKISNLASNAYDVFSWIDRDLAIDVATLDYNPYL